MIREIRQRFLQMVTLLNALSDLVVVFCALGVHGCVCFAQKVKLDTHTLGMSHGHRLIDLPHRPIDRLLFKFDILTLLSSLSPITTANGVPAPRTNKGSKSIFYG